MQRLEHIFNKNTEVKATAEPSSLTLFSQPALDEDTKKIVNHLKALNLSDNCTQRILSAVNKMPGKDHVKGALEFLIKMTDKKSKREDYYKHSPYFAEYFCTISNLNFFAVAFYYRDFATLFAGTFSALSHAIPLQRLHDLDFLGVFIIFAKVIGNYKLLKSEPEVLLYGATALTINLLDTAVTRKHLDKIGPTLHVAWHFAASWALYKFNQAQAGAPAPELENVLLATSALVIPTFLEECFNLISAHITDEFSVSSPCVIL